MPGFLTSFLTSFLHSLVCASPLAQFTSVFMKKMGPTVFSNLAQVKVDEETGVSLMNYTSWIWAPHRFGKEEYYMSLIPLSAQGPLLTLIPSCLSHFSGSCLLKNSGLLGQILQNLGVRGYCCGDLLFSTRRKNSWVDLRQTGRGTIFPFLPSVQVQIDKGFNPIKWWMTSPLHLPRKPKQAQHFAKYTEGQLTVQKRKTWKEQKAI